MNKHPLVFSLVLLMMGYGVLMTGAMAEDGDNTRPSEAEINNNEPVTVRGNEPKLLPMEIKNTSRAKQKKRSIEMIVGGQSEDGVAKQVILPVGN